MDTKVPELGGRTFSAVTGLDKFYQESVPDVDVFHVPTSRPAAPDASADAGASASDSGSLRPPPPADAPEWQRVGKLVSIVHRYTIDLPLPDDPGFRKDLRVGTRGKIVQVGDSKVKNPKLKIEGEVMHDGEPVDFKDWVTVRSLAPISPDGQDAPEAAPEADAVPENIVNAHITDNDVAWVDDWRSLVEDGGPSALFQGLKAMTTMAMRYVHARMPPITEKDVGVLHRKNA